MNFNDKCESCYREAPFKECDVCFNCLDCCDSRCGIHLARLKVGEAFKYGDNTYIAITLTPDPAEVICLNTETKRLEEIYEGEYVLPLGNWKIERAYEPVEYKDALEVLW